MSAGVKKRLKILFADDGSQHAQAAIRLLLDLPLPPKIQLHVLRVFPPGQTFAVGQMERGLARTREQFMDSGVKVKTDLVLGYPSEKIVETAAEMKPDLTILGAKGLRATLGILLGGVAQQVVEYACCPVLVVRAPYDGLRRVLMVTDGSSYSLRAARYLTKFPLPEDVDIRLMHVLPPLTEPIIMEPYFGGRDAYVPLRTPEEEARLKAEQEKDGQKVLEKTQAVFRKAGIKSTAVMTRGDAATEIIEYAKDEKVDLLVAGSRGLSRVKGWLMGSVSRKLVHYAECSVMVVKKKEI